MTTLAIFARAFVVLIGNRNRYACALQLMCNLNLSRQVSRPYIWMPNAQRQRYGILEISRSTKVQTRPNNDCRAPQIYELPELFCYIDNIAL